MIRNRVRLLALAATVGFGACGDSTDLVLGELSEAEAADLAAAVVSATFAGTGSIPQPALTANGPAMVPFEFAAEIETEFPCQLGGVVDVAASIEVQGDTGSPAGSVQYSMTQIHDACVVMSEGGQLFTLWGNPSLNVAFSVENDGLGVVEWGGSVQGIVDWVTDGRRGSCDVAMEFAGRHEGGASLAASMIGTVCGFGIDHSVSLDVGSVG